MFIANYSMRTIIIEISKLEINLLGLIEKNSDGKSRMKLN